MPRLKTTAPSPTRRHGGFSIVELIGTATVLAIVTAVGVIGISKARANVRLSGSAREFASYVEKARVFSIRRHADDATERASVVINADQDSYDVTMDLDGDGGNDTRTIDLPSGITFETVESISFDWRGRTMSTVAGVTTSNAQVSIRLLSSDDSISIDVTGSGDITVDSQVFDDSVPDINLHVADLAAGPTPVPTPIAAATPTPPVAVATPDPTQNPGDLPIPDDGNVIPVPTPTPAGQGQGNGNGNPHATPTPTPTATPTPTPTPVPVVCTISADKSGLNLNLDGTSTIKVSHNLGTSVSISGISSKASDLQVTPGGAQNVSAGGFAPFTIKSKRALGIYSVTFSSSCGTKTVPVIVALLTLL